jgi:[acyl-carrier-protein] S-malonyltransferase
MAATGCACIVDCNVQVTSPVLWENTMTTLFDKGLGKSYEIGPGKVVAGIAKRINKAHDITNITA